MSSVLDADNVCIDDLPRVLREMVALIGMPATLTVVQHHGGLRLYVPMTKNLTPQHILARQIGFDAAVKLCDEYGGMDHFDIPLAVAAMRAARNAEIVKSYVEGATARQLASTYRMTERGVTMILSKQNIGKDDRQAALF